MLVYLIFAPSLYIRFVLKDGKPLSVEGGIPVTSDGIKLTIDGLSPYVFDGQDLYMLSGWAFSVQEKNISPGMYERTIVLVSDSKTYHFPTETIQRPGVQEFYKDLGMNLIDSGFRALIAKDVLQPGEYRIGIIFRDPSTELSSYSDKPRRIVLRTPNQLTLK